jgi:hypothetical protein
MTDFKLLQQALDALEFPRDSEWSNKAKAIEALQHALAQPEQPDLRKAAEIAFDALRLYVTMYPQMDRSYMVDAREALRQALAQPEQEKESTPVNVDPRLLLSRNNNYIKETGNRLCDIERRLAAIEIQPLAKPEFDTPESHIVKWSIPVDPNNFGEPLAQPEQPDLRKAAEMALEALEIGTTGLAIRAIPALRQALAKPEHPLDKKSDNARELGLDYEPEHGFDRTASHMAGEYVDTAGTEHQFKYVAYGLRADENGKLSIGELPKREWVCKNCGEQNVD